MKAAPRGDCGFISCAVGTRFLGSEYAELLRSSGSPLANVKDVYLSNYCGYEAPTSSSLLRKTLVQIYADLKFVLVETKKAAKEAELADGEWKDLKSKRLSDFDEPNGLRETDIVVLAADFEAATGIGFLSCYHYVRVTSTDPHGDVRRVDAKPVTPTFAWYASISNQQGDWAELAQVAEFDAVIKTLSGAHKMDAKVAQASNLSLSLSPFLSTRVSVPLALSLSASSSLSFTHARSPARIPGSARR